MDPLSGTNPTNNPRVDLLHGTGDNQQLAGVAGSYGPEPATVPPAPALPPPAPVPSPRAEPQPSVAPKSAKAYVEKAESKVPEAPVPLPKPAPAPEPRPAPTVPSQQPEKSGRGKVIALALLILIVALALGGGGYYYLTHRHTASAPTAPSGVAISPITPTALSQQSDNSSLAEGKTTNKSTITFTFTVQSSATTGSLTPEVELEPVGTAFTGQPTYTGHAVNATGGSLHFSVATSTLKDGGYHWQVRDSAGSQHSSWAIFGGDASAMAFTVSTAVSAAPTVSSIGGVAIANPTTVTSNQPAIVGTATPGATITIAIGPDAQDFTTTADSSGNWTLTPGKTIPNGQHTVTITATDSSGNASSPVQIALVINPATAAQTAPVTAAPTTPAASSASPSTTPVAGAPAATTTPAGSTHLAQTGDNTDAMSAASLLAMALAAAGLIWMRRRYVFR